MNNFVPKLNKVDQHIKSLMLTYPGLFKCRMDVLKHLFMVNGNGYEWDDMGCLAQRMSMNGEVSALNMDFSDLEEEQAELDKQVADNPTDALRSYYAAKQARLKRCFAERRIIAEEIDLYAVEHVMREDDKFGVEWLKDFSPNYCVLSDAPFEKLDPEWAAAAEEALMVARNALWRVLGMYSDHFSCERADRALLEKYDEINGLLDKLGVVTNRKAKEVQCDEIADRLIEFGKLDG